MTDEPQDGLEQARRIANAAQLDQAKAGVETLTELIATYFQSLLAKGFTREEALGLTVEYQSDVLGIKREEGE